MPDEPTVSQRLLKSPFNGAAWPVPPDMTEAMYDELVKRGFVPIPPVSNRKDKS